MKGNTMGNAKMHITICTFLLAAWAAPAAAFQAQAAATPVEKVISLLGRLSNQIAEEGKKEAAEYDKYACFCKEQADEKLYNIEKSDAKIEKLKATIEKLTGEIAELEEDIKKLTKRLGEIKDEMKSETEKRDKQVEKFKKADKEFEEAIDAVGQAIEVLQESKKDMKNAKKNLLQVAALSRSFPANPKVQLISALLEQKPPPKAPGAKPAAYEYRSNDIIATLQELSDEFKAEKKKLFEDDFEKKAIYDELMVGLKNEKKFKEEEKKEKTEIAAEKTEEKEAAEEDKKAETKARDADQEFLDELTKQCGSKAEEWDQRSKTRSAELTAIAEAVEILKSGVKDNYAANRKLAGLQKAAKRSPASFLQAVLQKHGGTGGGASATKTALVARALQLLDARAASLDSPGLVALAAKVAVHGDQFAKVKELINDLIEKLEKQAKDEADQKSFCDKEMKKALEKRDGEALSKEENSAKIAKKTAEVKQLKRDIADLSGDIAELARGLSEATELRADEKQDNKKTLEDAKAGKAAVEQAIEVLQGFYGLLQKQRRDPVDRDGNSLEDMAPKTSYKGDYKGKGDAGGGIIGILEIILEDFEKTIEDVESEESDAQEAFDELKKETEESTEKKSDEKDEKEKKIDEATEDITKAKEALENADEMHAAAMEELEKLQAMCVEGEYSWEERKKKREEEIKALKGALKILEEWKD